jgi:formylglycine-generating enzyme required for sulfatase activity
LDPSLESLLRPFEQTSGQFREIHEGVRRVVRIAGEDPEMALTRCRKVLELVVREVFERRVGEPAGTRPLENLLQRLFKEGHLPARLHAYANAVRMLGNVGSHHFGEQLTPADVRQSLAQLAPVLEWYVQVERPPSGPWPGQPSAQPVPDAAPAPRPASRGVVVPKGLRSFDAIDADFFLDLLPSPRDRTGLPESVRFWKHAIEEAAEPAFTVGVVYGPSGCGKSSLVKAGLLPRLSDCILPVYIQATSNDTEPRLLNGLRRRYSGLPAELGLVDRVAALRHEPGVGRGRKVLLVLDQFEQWLHARTEDEGGELARALRQCDGERVQCLLLVRADFWVALSRFMGDLHIDLVQGRNTALVDLFDPTHARAVLAAFGRAFGRLPPEPTREQAAFLDQAVAGLSEGGRVIPVRLALFAEMVKCRSWTPATLKDLGGIEGVGVAFLEDALGAAAPVRNRQHREAARAVLTCLLPDLGIDIKGMLHSRDKLLLASGYVRRPGDFEDLLRLLDSELRLLTPTEPELPDPGVGEQPGVAGGRYYQLTHDYLVPALREWLTRRQKETWRGRAELRLAERAALWVRKPESRHLPAWWEWLDIRLLTRKKEWTPPQRRMMRKAARFHLARGAALAAVLAAAVALGLTAWGRIDEQRQKDEAAALVRAVATAQTADVPGLVQELEPHRRWADPLLREALAEAEANHDGPRRLRATLALLPTDRGQLEPLTGRLLDAERDDLPVLIDSLEPHRSEVVGPLWRAAEEPAAGQEERFLRAAAALAVYDPTSPRWDGIRGELASQLVRVDPFVFDFWSKRLGPVHDKLVVPLCAVFRDPDRTPGERELAAKILAAYAGDLPDVLADLLLDADETKWKVLWPTLDGHQAEAVRLFRAELDRPMPQADHLAERDRLARRQAQAAVALLRLGEAEAVWPVFRHTPDPGRRTYLIQRLARLGAEPGPLVQRLAVESDVSARRALILSLGEFTDERLPAEVRQPLLDRLLAWYRDDPDPGLHAAIDWLLRQSKEGKTPRPLDWRQAEALTRADGEQALLRYRGQLGGLLAARGPLAALAALPLTPDRLGRAGRAPPAPPNWYFNCQGQTLAILPSPTAFPMGASAFEGDQTEYEVQHRQTIGRRFAIATRDVTVRQFREFLAAHPEVRHEEAQKFSPDPAGPVICVTWYEAAAYCRWLSEREGLAEDEMYYPPVAEIEKLRKANRPLAVPTGRLRRTGYRLPTEGEWEYACRAGAETAWFCGSAEELLPRYAWLMGNAHNRAWPVGQKRPNDFGLFDMHGNVRQWCQNPPWRYEPAVAAARGGVVEDGDQYLDLKNVGTYLQYGENHMYRGGSFYDLPGNMRCAYRDFDESTDPDKQNGFRVARTCP